jgi:GABA permease
VLRLANRALSTQESAVISLGGLIGAGLFAGGYWTFWTLVVAIEALAGANILAPTGGLAGLLTAIVLLAVSAAIDNKLSVSLSELEVSFAGLKVAIITAFYSLAGVGIVHAVSTSPASSARDPTGAFGLMSVRVFGIYLASITLILTVVRANTIRPGFSPFTLTLRALDHPQAAAWLGVVILIAVLTTLNIGLTIGSRLPGRFSRRHDRVHRYRRI